MDAVTLADAFPEAAAAGRALAARGRTVAVAESCTGGLLGAALTAVPGSSAWVRGGVIAYADDVKRGLLGVDAALLAEAGAVSEAVAVAMAAGARERCGADVGAAITGIAGPGGDTGGKAVGLTFVAVAGAHGTVVERLDGDEGREANRARAVATALRLIGTVASQ